MPEMISVSSTKEGLVWAIASTAAVAFGWRGILTLIWIMSMILDYVTGTIAAAKKGEWNSARAREGMFHKGGMLAVVCAAILLDLLIRTVQQSGIVTFPFAYKAVLMPVVIAGYTITEIGSSIENAAAMGTPIHPWLLQALKIASEAVQSAGKKVTGTEKEKDDSEEQH